MGDKRLFRCACGGDVVSTDLGGERYPFGRMLTLRLAPGSMVPACVQCGETYLTVLRGLELERDALRERLALVEAKLEREKQSAA